MNSTASNGGSPGSSGEPSQVIYVSPNGDDSWSGRLPEATPCEDDGPFRTLKKATTALLPGQTCFLRQGVYRETLKPLRDGEPGRPIVFRNYRDEVAEICGADALAGWTRDDGSIWRASMDWDLEDQNQLFANGLMLDEARWPKNAGGSPLSLQRAKAESGDFTTLCDPAIPGGDGAWKGAILWCAGGDRWICWSEKVLGFDARKHALSFNMIKPENWYVVRKDSPYVLMGVKAALSSEGEWLYDRERRQMLLIPPEGMALAGAVIEAKRRLHCIDLSGRSHIDMTGLRFRAGGVLMDGRTSDVRLSRCVGKYVAHSYAREVEEESGVMIRGQGNSVESCELSLSSTSVLSVKGTGHRIVNCLIRDGNYGGKWKGAVALAGRKILFSHNTVRDSGRDLVSIHDLMESVIQHNDLSGAGWLTCDLGMVYGHSTDFMNTEIRYNKIYGNRAGACAMGIYFDHCSHNVIVHHNLVLNAAHDPIQVNNPSYFVIVANNSCFASGEVSTFDHSGRDDLFGARFVNNIFDKGIKLPGHVALVSNLCVDASPYVDPEHGDFSLRPGSKALGAGSFLRGITDVKHPDIGAFQSGKAPWRAGHDFSKPPLPPPQWTPADIDWMNCIRNACFELDDIEFWTPFGPGEVKLSDGNAWGNAVSGSASGSCYATGTSKHELRLGGGRVGVTQKVEGLHSGVEHTLSGWFRVSVSTESLRMGIRNPDGTELWAESVNSVNWVRVSLSFKTGPEQSSVTVVLSKDSDGPGYAFCDNLGLPKASRN